MMTPVEDAVKSGRRAMLEAIRDRLVQVMDGTAGHQVGCECECGAPWDTGKLAGLARELREVIRELDDLPEQSGGTEVERIQSERESRRLQAEREDQGQAGE